jgi:hypothetical protein
MMPCLSSPAGSWSKKPLSGDMEVMAVELARVKEQKEMEVKKIAVEISEIEQIVNGFKTAVIKIIDCVYPFVRCEVWDCCPLTNRRRA